MLLKNFEQQHQGQAFVVNLLSIATTSSHVRCIPQISTNRVEVYIQKFAKSHSKLKCVRRVVFIHFNDRLQSTCSSPLTSLVIESATLQKVHIFLVFNSSYNCIHSLILGVSKKMVMLYAMKVDAIYKAMSILQQVQKAHACGL